MRVLIAEDDVTSRLLLTRVLESWGYEVTATKDGAEALQALQAEDAPRLAILDWMMPGMDGVDVCRRVRSRETLQPPYIILLTALGDKKSVVAGLEAGADDYVGKPYDPDEMRARLEVGRRLVELNDDLLEAQQALQILACTDALTGVLNRGAIVKELEREAERSAREGVPLGLGMLDIDHLSSSTTPTATPPVMRCSARSCDAFSASCGPTTASGASGARSSSCSCPDPARGS